MFDALNRFISRLDESQPQSSNNHDGYGFQVLHNKDSNVPIEPWFDFIIGINGRRVDYPDPPLFAQEVRNCAGASVTLGVWSAKGQRIRELQLLVPKDPPSLGLALQWTSITSTQEVWHILDVAPDSPAEQAGLLPYGDYIIGTPEGIVRGEAGMGELIEDHLSRPLELYVYNHEYNLTRPVTITPSRSWGGSAALGCTLGYGALHHLPAPLQEPPQAPGETLFEAATFEVEGDAARSAFVPASSIAPPGSSQSPLPAAEFLVPANQPNMAPPPSAGRTASPSTHKAGRRARAVHGLSADRAMDEYFQEGEAKSREMDNAPSPVGGAKGVPPPPKAGGASQLPSTEPASSAPGE